MIYQKMRNALHRAQFLDLWGWNIGSAPPQVLCDLSHILLQRLVCKYTCLCQILHNMNPFRKNESPMTSSQAQINSSDASVQVNFCWQIPHARCVLGWGGEWWLRKQCRRSPSAFTCRQTQAREVTSITAAINSNQQLPCRECKPM